MSDIDTKW